jgi:hypothetical protein
MNYDQLHGIIRDGEIIGNPIPQCQLAFSGARPSLTTLTHPSGYSLRYYGGFCHSGIGDLSLYEISDIFNDSGKRD